MIKTTYHCDKCKKEVKEKSDLNTLEIKFTSWQRIYATRTKKFDACIDCAIELGLIVKKNEKIENAPNVKDKLYDALIDMMVEVQEGGEGL